MPYKENHVESMRALRDRKYLRQIAIVIYKAEEELDRALTSAMEDLHTTRPEYIRHALFEKLERDGYLEKPSE